MRHAAGRGWLRLPPGPLLAALLLAGCGSASEEAAPEAAIETPAALPSTPVTAVVPAASQLAPGFAPITFDFANTGWLVTAIDGVPTGDLQDNLVTIHFTGSRLFWNACNHGEAIYIPVAGSFALGSTITTVANCPDATPDRTLGTILSAHPLIGRNAEGKVMLSAKGRTVTLSEIDSGRADERVPPLELAPFALATADAPAERPVLAIGGGRFTLWMDCADAITGTARLVGKRLRISGVQSADCATHRPTARKEIADFLRRSPTIAQGANGELLMTDGQTVIAASQCHPDPSPCTHALHSPQRPDSATGA